MNAALVQSLPGDDPQTAKSESDSQLQRGPGDLPVGEHMVKHEALKNHLEGLRNSIPELRGVLLASTEGLPVAHSLSNGTDPNRVAAMAAAASSLGRRISESMSTGNLSEVSIRGDDGVLFIYSAGPKAVLAVMGPMGANAGLIHLEARNSAKEIGDLF
jgi:uncharacterized protein